MKGELEGMCNLADRIEEKAIEKGMRKGIELGIEQEKVNAVVTLIRTLHLSFEEAIRVLEVPDSLIASCREYVNKMLSV